MSEQTTLAYIHTYAADLTAPLRVNRLTDIVAAGDGNAHLFRVTLGGLEPESAMAYAVRPDGVTVVIPCEEGSDSLCFILPAQALSEPGRVEVLLRAFAGDSVTTLLWCSLTVRPGLSESLTDPEETIPSLEELLAKIADCGQAAQEARTAAASCTDQVTQAAASAAQAQSAADAMAEELSPLLTRVDAADTALAAHGTRLTSLEQRTAADTLAELFCPEFSAGGTAVTCWPSPGSTVMLSLAAEGTAFHASTPALWSCSDMATSGTYCYATGSTDGTDVAVPAGSWSFSWKLQGVSSSATYTIYWKLGSEGSTQRSNRAGVQGSLTITAAQPTTLSLWLYKASSGWDTLGNPALTGMLASGTAAELGWQTHSGCVQAASSFISPAAHTSVLVWTEDGSTFTAGGREDLPHALEAMA